MVYTYIRDSLREVDTELEAAALSLKAPLGQRVGNTYLPFLIPPMPAAGRSGSTLSWKEAFLAETFGFPSGLGRQVKTSYDIMTLLAARALHFRFAGDRAGEAHPWAARGELVASSPCSAARR